jgi:hypothetical protein
VPLEPDADGVVALRPAALLERFAGGGAVADGGALPTRLVLPVVLRASAGGERVSVVKRVVISAASRQNRNPRLLVMLADGLPLATERPLRIGNKLELQAIESPRDFERYEKDGAEAGAMPVPEQHGVAWFTTAGEFDHGSTAAGLADGGVRFEKTILTAPAVPGRVRIWAVVTDSRGGAAWEERALEIVQ